MTQADFAELVGVDQSMITRIMAGPEKKQRRNPSLDLILKIVTATAGAVTANDFLPEPAAVDRENRTDSSQPTPVPAPG